MKNIKNELLKLSDKKYAEFNKKLTPGVDRNQIGIRIPILRNKARELVKKYSLDEILAKIDDEFYEEIMLQGFAIRICQNRAE